MLDRIHEIFEDLERHRVMLSFKGGVTQELIPALLGVVERKMNDLEPDARTRKRLFNVVVECLQNLYRHNLKVRSNNGGPAPEKDPHGVIMIARTDEGYSVLTGNFMSGQEVDRLRGHLDRINSLSSEDLRGLYMETLTNGEFGKNGGGGLGMIDIARKSGGKLEYGFTPYDDHSAFFSLNVNVTT